MTVPSFSVRALAPLGRIDDAALPTVATPPVEGGENARPRLLDLPDRMRRRIVVAPTTPTNPSRPLTSACWVWTGGLFPAGYGSYWHDGRTVLIHRAVYELLVAPLPPRSSFQWIDHVCRVRACCNPEHLELVTPAENQHRSTAATKAACVHGHLWTPENTGRLSSAPNQRRCRACARERWHARQRREAAA